MFTPFPPTLCLLLALASADTFLAHAVGQYGAATSQALLVDHSRKDPYAAETGLNEDRKLMLSAFYATSLYKDCVKYKSAYMPSATAVYYENIYAAVGIPNNTFSSLTMEHCREANSEFIADRDFPLALFSPGLGNSRLLYSAMAQSLASEEFVVITIDHTYDAEIVEYLDGSVVLAASIETDKQIDHAVDVRVHDVQSLLNHLGSTKGASSLLPDRSCSLNISEAVMFGHSLGGAAAVAAALNDTRLVAAINLDGTVFGHALSEGSKVPMLLLGHDGKNLTNDASWSSVWKETKNAAKLALSISNTEHGSYTDFPLLLDVVEGIPQSVRDQLVPLIGTLSGNKARRIVSKVVGQFFKFALDRSAFAIPHLSRNDTALLNTLGKHVKI